MKLYIYNKKLMIFNYIFFIMMSILSAAYMLVKIFTSDYDVAVFFSIWGLIFIPPIFIIALLTQRKWGTFKDTVTIDEMGITFSGRKKSFIIKWENVGCISVGGAGFNGMPGFIHIFSEMILDDYEEHRGYRSFLINGIKYIDEDYIFFGFSKDVYREIKKYYDSHILREYELAMRGWYVE